METNRPRVAPAEDTNLTVGAPVLLYAAGGSYETVILQLVRDRVCLAPPPRGKQFRLHYDQAVSLNRTFSDGRTLMTLLRYQERSRMARGEQDIFYRVSGGQVRLWPGMNRLAMHDWCRVKIFEIYEPDKLLAEEDGFLYALSAGAAELLVARELPLGAFAECTFALGGETVTARMALTKAEKLEGDPFCRAEFSFVDPGLQPRVGKYLMEEKARRLYTAGIG